MHSGLEEPVNLGSTEQVSVNELLDVVESIAGVRLKRVYDLSKPQGVQGRNSDNTLLRQTLTWEPETPLANGLATTYAWIEAEVREQLKRNPDWKSAD